MYVVSFTQAAALAQAQALASVEVVGAAGKAAIKDAVGGFRFGKGFGATLRRLVLHGIGVHHAGMLPKYRRLVEALAQAGLLAVICGTDTLGVGINVPIRTVLLTSLTKYDGRKQRVLSARELHQIAGRAGRAGFDTVGYVVVQAPEQSSRTRRRSPGPGRTPRSAVGWCAASRPRAPCRTPSRRTSAWSRRNRSRSPPRCGSTTRWCSTCWAVGRDSRPPCTPCCWTTTRSRPGARHSSSARCRCWPRCCGPGSSSPTTARPCRTGCLPMRPILLSLRVVRRQRLPDPPTR